MLWGGAFLLFFLDFAGFTPDFFGLLPKLQLIPALLRLWIPGLVFLCVLTLVLGRIYCSVMCPLGILQDAIGHIKKLFYRIRKQKNRLFTRYEPARNITRYTILAACIVLFAAGVSTPLIWLDPYGHFGRIAVGLVSPVYTTTNNLLAQAHVGALYATRIAPSHPIVLLTSIGTLMLLGAMVWKKERLFCNLLCPAGHLLSLFSRFSLFRIQISTPQCNHCGMCAKNCKSACIESQAQTIDHSRCVTCFNCLPQCHRGALKFKPVNPFKTAKMTPGVKEPHPHSITRRSFLQGAAATSMAGPLVFASPFENKKVTPLNRKFPMPPGAKSLVHFQSRCTACQLCVSKCPTHVLQPNGMEYGFVGMMQPAMFFEPHRYCSFECTKCIEVCPNGALQPLSTEEKKRLQIGIVHFILQECIVETNQKDCGACAEHCPTQAVTMVAYKNGLTIPQIDTTLCIGCGGCESICPVRPKAIFIEGLMTHAQAREPESRKPDEIQVDDFGF